MVVPVSTDDVRFAIVAETTAGVTPATPVWHELPLISDGLQSQDNARASAVIGGQARGPRDTVLLGREITGPITVGMVKAPAMDFLLESLFASRWAANPQALTGTWTNKMYVASNPRTFTIEKRWQIDGTPTYRYHRFTGCQVATGTFAATPNDEMQATFDFLGQEAGTFGAEVAGSTYVSVGSAPVMSVPDVSMTVVDPAGPTTLVDTANDIVTQLTLTMPNNLRGIDAVNVLGRKATVLGRMEPTIAAAIYYTGDGLIQAAEARTELVVQLVMKDSDDETYTFDFPRCKFQTAPYPLVGGTGQDAVLQTVLQPLVGVEDDETYIALVTRTPYA